MISVVECRSQTIALSIYIFLDRRPTFDSEGSHLDVLPGCALYMQMKLKRVTDGGDHDLALCEVIGTGIWDDAEKGVRWLSDDDVGNPRPALDNTSALYSGQLRDEGII
jgi:hypothetical protein